MPCGASLDEVLHGHGRGAVGLPRGAEGGLLPFPLEIHPGEQVVAVEIRRVHLGHQARIGKARIALLVAHAVHYHATGFAAALDHLAAGAHAEAVGGAIQAEVADQLVVRGRQGGMSCAGPVLGAIDEVLGMLHPHAHGEGLLAHGDAMAV